MHLIRSHGLRVLVGLVSVVVIGVLVLVGVNLEQQHRGQLHAAKQNNPSGSLGHVAVPKDSDDFRRFRIGSIDGNQLTPNKTDFAARTADDGPLLLFLPATRAKPSDYQLFLSEAVSQGYHVLGLDYWNLGMTLSGTCETDPHCYTQVQRNRFDGGDSSDFSSVPAAGSITSRFRDAITHLSSVDPAGGWSRFVLSDGDINWSQIVVAGHSQGGGEAAFIAHIRSVKGALMFSSPVESDGAFHAAWMDRPGDTPVSRMYSLDDRNDVFGPRIWGSWKVLGLDGAHGPFNTVTAAPGTGQDPHAIMTHLDVGDPGQSHSFTIDDSTPLAANGTPRMLPLWTWMLTRFNQTETHADSADTENGVPVPEPSSSATATSSDTAGS